MADTQEALEAIASMDQEGLRADDLGRAATVARNALSAAPAQPTEQRPVAWLLMESGKSMRHFVHDKQTADYWEDVRPGCKAVPLYVAPSASPVAPAQQASEQPAMIAAVDWAGLALDLEQQAKRVESKTAKRVMNAAAHGLRLMGAALLSQQAGSVAESKRATCEWDLTDDENGIWESSCGETWTFIDGGPIENNMKFCHCCAGLLKVADKAEGGK